MHDIIYSLKTLIIQAGKIAIERKKAGLVVEIKSDASPVTNADKEVSTLITENLKQLTPHIPVISEEDNIIQDNNVSQDFWLVDPIDGTISYIKGQNTYTINIGLIKDGIPQIGLIYQPVEEKLYYTDETGTLQIEQFGRRISPLKLTKKDRYKAVVSTDYFTHHSNTLLKEYSIDIIVNMASSIKLCLIAEGSADIYPRFGQTMEWDIAAGHALIKAAGGEVLTLEGWPLTYGKKQFSNPDLVAYSKRWLENRQTISI